MKTTRDANYSSKIIKAGALLPDTKLLLENWHKNANVETNPEQVRQNNLLGKASRSRVEDILLVLRQRYLKDPEVLKALVALARGGMSAEMLDRILHFQAARSDPLLHDLVTELLADWSTRSDREVRKISREMAKLSKELEAARHAIEELNGAEAAAK